MRASYANETRTPCCVPFLSVLATSGRHTTPCPGEAEHPLARARPVCGTLATRGNARLHRGYYIVNYVVIRYILSERRSVYASHSESRAKVAGCCTMMSAAALSP